jgi:hypothetical protein
MNDWPIYLAMRPTFYLPAKLSMFKAKVLNSNVIEELQKGNRHTAERTFKLVCGLAEKLDSFIPCMELADCQESLKQCLQILEGLLPYGYSREVQWSAKPPV